MGTIYMGIIMVFRVVQALFNKRASNQVHGYTLPLQYTGIRQLMSAAMALVLILIAGKGFCCDGKTVLISVLSGSMLALSSVCSLFAMKSGTIALSSLFGTAGLLVPTVAGIFLFHIPVQGMQWLGMLIFFVSAYLMISGSKKVFGRFDLKTFLLLLGVLFGEGFTMLAQQMFTYYVPEGDVSVFSLLSFGIVGAVLLLCLPLVSKSSHEEVKPLPGTLWGYGIALSLAVFAINQFATLATAIVPPVILFTVINGGATIIAAVVGRVCFGEKLTPQSVFGIILGIGSMVMIKIFN